MRIQYLKSNYLIYDLEIIVIYSVYFSHLQIIFQLYYIFEIFPLIQKSLSYLNEDGVSCWNVGKVSGRNMFDDVNVAHSQMNYAKISSFAVVSSKRPTLQNNNGNAKSNDITEIYKK